MTTKTKTKRKRTKTAKTLCEVLSPRQARLDEVLLRALRRSEKSCYTICAETGLDKAVLSRFKAGQRDLRLTTAATLAEYLGLRLVDGDA